MTQPHSHYWLHHTDGGGTWGRRGAVPGADLAALRRGIGRDAGTVPPMWPFYTTLRADGQGSASLNAEHCALTLFAVHQQSQRTPVHRGGVGLGTAIQALRQSGKFSADAVDRRFSGAATATTLGEVSHHLRGLITQLRGITGPPGLDYTQLFHDLRNWQFPESQARVRRTWGSQYFTWTPKPDPATAAQPTPA
jgi:CRISPR system Cascade subunit CasB